MKRAVYSIPLLGMSLMGCGEDPIVAKFDGTVFNDLQLPAEESYTDPVTNVTCTVSYAMEMEVSEGLKALISLPLSYVCDDNSQNVSLTYGYVADVEIVESGAKYNITFGATILTCTMDAESALTCTDQDQAAWAFQLAN
jgi:hypothetical protein